MTPEVPSRPRLLLVGGGGGLVGRHVLAEFARDHRIRSLHRHPTPAERALGVETLEADIATFDGWERAVDGVDLVVNVAWYRAGPRRRFVTLCDGLLRLLAAARRAGVRRFVQVSVPRAPDHLEAGFPYLTEKRRFDAALAASGVPYRILRPTMLFGPGDVLVDVMVRSMRRYPFFPMFGDGGYHVSPLAVSDLAGILRSEAASDREGTQDLGGPRRYEYRALTDLLFAAAGRSPRYWRMRPSNGVRLARLLEGFGSHLLYAYEVQWLVADLLGLDAWAGPPGALTSLEAYLSERFPTPGDPRRPAPVRP